MMTVYNGNVTTDANGFARVSLPSYFGALNTELKYQLTCIGTFAQAIIAEEVRDNQFVIQTDKPNVKVSWQVTAYATILPRARRIVPEQENADLEVGKYICPEVYGKGHDQLATKPLPNAKT